MRSITPSTLFKDCLFLHGSFEKQIYFKILLHVLAYMISISLYLLFIRLGHLHGRLFLFLKSTSIPSSSLLPEVIVLCIWHCGSVCRWWWHLQQRPRFNWGINAMSRWGLGRQLFSLNGNFYNKDWQMWKHRDLGYAVYEPRNSICRQSVPWLFIPSWDLL